MRVDERISNPFSPSLSLSQNLALQRAAQERKGIAKPSTAGQMAQPPFVPGIEFSGNPELPDWGLGEFGREAAKHLWATSTEEVDPATKMRMWRRAAQERR